MRVTKYVHSCLLVEDDDSAVLFDPGQMSWESRLLDIDKLQRLDSIIITHEHFDHYYDLFVRALKEKFPDTEIITTPSLAEKLNAADFTNVKSIGTAAVEIVEAPHESMEPLAPGPTVQNIGVNYKGLLTHPGDSYHILSSKDIFALPLAGPWGAAIDGIRLATALKPKIILPIHDWMWNDFWRQDMYGRLQQYFYNLGIKFINFVDGMPVEL